jgi:hypothetical protein
LQQVQLQPSLIHLRCRMDDDDWGAEDFLKLMLGEDDFHSITQGGTITAPITTFPHAPPQYAAPALHHEPNPSDFHYAAQPSSRSSSLSPLQLAFNELEQALLQAGPTAPYGPYTILTAPAGAIVRKYVPDKQIKLKDIIDQDRRFAFHANGVNSTISLQLTPSQENGASDSTNAVKSAMDALFQAVAALPGERGLDGSAVGLIVRKYVVDKQIKVKDLVQQDGRFVLVHLNDDFTGPISVRLKQSQHPAPEASRSFSDPPTDFLRERATPMWKKLSFHEKRSYGVNDPTKAFYSFARTLWEKESVHQDRGNPKTLSSDPHVQAKTDEDRAKHALASALIKIGQNGSVGPYSMAAAQAGVIVHKYCTSKKMREIISESPYFNWSEQGTGTSICSLSNEGRMHYIRVDPGPSASTTGFLNSPQNKSNPLMDKQAPNPVRVYGPIISPSDPNFDLLLEALLKRNPTHVGITCQYETGSSLFLELAFGGNKQRGHVYRFDLLKADSSDIQTMLLTLQPLLFESPSIEKVTADSGLIIEKLVQFLPPGTRIAPVFDLKVYAALSALPTAAKKASELLVTGTDSYGCFSLGQMDHQLSAMDLVERQKSIREPPNSLSSSIALSLSQLHMDASSIEWRNRMFGQWSGVESLASLSHDPSKWLKALMILAIDEQ